MIRVTVWNEFVQEQMEGKEAILKVHPGGIHETLKGILAEDDQMQIRTATLEMPECGLSEQVLNDTDVLVWWGHVAHDRVPDEIAERVRQHVLRGMGLVALHSAHLSKPLTRVLGTSCTLKWREGDRSRVWTVDPTHPIAQGIPAYIDLPEEEMYGEFFDIPTPEDQVFISWFAGGEVFRSGCTWKRGYGKVFYFQPGHETNESYHNPHIRRVIQNAVRWAMPTIRMDVLDCPHIERALEADWK
ncbi:ThuA domain-containing protein [Eubacteriales bacterium OttesenSCG-928-N13]|nr:ThuA domain-containing protein [Eubacteriales bacterium OttesenSCG-928-N13]